MAQGQISWGSVLVGALIGGGVAYVIVKQREKAKKAKTDEKIPLPPAPEGGLGEGGAHRGPLPYTEVWIPQTPQDRQNLDQMICNVWNSYEERPQLDDVLFAVLDELAPEGQWPSVAGDHASIPSLQAIVMYRIEQIGVRNKSMSIADNFNEFCIETVAPPVPPGPQGLAG